MKPTLCEVIAVVISVAVIVQSAPAENNEVRLVSGVNRRYPNGDYEYSFTQNDGTKVEQKGTLIDVNNTKVYRVTGYYAYKDSSDTLQIVNYQADENGYNITMQPTEMYPALEISGKAIASILG